MANAICDLSLDVQNVSVRTAAKSQLSERVTVLFCRSLPVVESNLAIALSVEEAGHTTSPVPLTVAHFIHVASALSAVRTCPFDPTASREAVFAPVPTARSPFASHIESVATDQPPDIVKSPLPRSELPLTVFMLVHDTRVACFASSAVCVAVDIGSSARVQSFGLFESDTSAMRIISHVAGVTQVVSVGNKISAILRRDYSTCPSSSGDKYSSVRIVYNKRISRSITNTIS